MVIRLQMMRLILLIIPGVQYHRNLPVTLNFMQILMRLNWRVLKLFLPLEMVDRLTTVYIVQQIMLK